MRYIGTETFAELAFVLVQKLVMKKFRLTKSEVQKYKI